MSSYPLDKAKKRHAPLFSKSLSRLFLNLSFFLFGVNNFPILVATSFLHSFEQALSSLVHSVLVAVFGGSAANAGAIMAAQKTKDNTRANFFHNINFIVYLNSK